MEDEVWKDIDGFPGYQVSDHGRVRCFRDFHGNITDFFHNLKPNINKDDYYQVCLYTIDHKKVYKRIHRLVADAFLGKNDELVVDHIDGNKHNNNVNNLKWVTSKENSTLASKNGLYKTKPIQIIETGEVFRSIKECADYIGAHPSDISHCFNKNDVYGRTSYKGLHFKYINDKIESKPFLRDYQLEAVNNLNNGSILCGSVGSGKSRTGLFYYFKENGGWIDENGYVPMKNPQDLYIITTAKKRNSCEWLGELSYFYLSDKPEINMYKNKVIIDSWNNISKYKDVTGAFFLLDEQRIVGNGTWVKSFLKIAKNNNWILLSATPGDSYMDYLPVFLANGFFKNRTEFNREHVIYSRFTKYPKIEGYQNTRRLDRLRNSVLVKMNYKHEINIHHEDVYCYYDIPKYKDVIRNRWNPYKNEPIQQASGLCYVLRRIVNTDESREVALLEILEDHPKAIIFYSFDYELELLRHMFWDADGVEENPLSGFEVAEYNGHCHQEVPKGPKWVYLCQYTAACEGWECIKTDTIIFYSQNYSYKVMAQAAGRIDRLNTPYTDLYYYHLKSRSGIDLAISKALSQKKKFNETRWVNGTR